MLCENCNQEHNGSYGSGRFCSRKCAKSFSSKKSLGKTKLAKCIKCQKEYQILARASIHTFVCQECKPQFKTKNVCKECGKIIPKNFYVFCSKECGQKYGNRHHQMYEQQRTRAIIRKLKLIKLKGGCCEFCGYSTNIAALEFHHLYDKDFSLDFRHCANNSWKKLLAEIEKCQLLCANCHRELHNPHSITLILQKLYNLE